MIISKFGGDEGLVPAALDTPVPMKLGGWGNFPVVDSTLSQPKSIAELRSQLTVESPAFDGIARGLGRSYGDSSLAERAVDMRSFDQLVEFDETYGSLTCGAGASLADLLEVIVPRGWFLAVTPGTRYVTVGGAIASDVHGKNHHLAGSFCDHVESLRLMLPSGEVVTCSSCDNAELYRATCGGLGLTGVILDARLRLVPIRSALIDQHTHKTRDLRGTLDTFERTAAATYSVAWIDCMAKGPGLGRSLVMVGEHADSGPLATRRGPTVAVPARAPDFLLNRHVARTFNAAVYAKARRRESVSRIHYDPYFYPLDRVRNWNLLYGRKGLVQYQFVVPLAAGAEAMEKVLETISGSRLGAFLAVLKVMGKANSNLLSFPMAGYTLAVDFKAEQRTFRLLDALDAIVVASGGRVYLTKDARLGRETFRATYPNWQEFRRIREAIGADRAFNSVQSRRLGI